MNLWELMSSGSSANARKNSATNQPRYVSAEEFNAIPSPKEQWNNNSLYKSNVAPQINPADMNGFQPTVAGSGSLSNGLWNNGVGAQNPLSVGYTPTQVDTVAKAPIGAGNTPPQPSTPAPTLYASNQASNANGAPTIQNATMSNPMQEATNPMDMSMPVEMPSGYNVSDPTSGLAANSFGGTSTPHSFMDNFTDFSSMDATKNSLGNIATGVNVGTGLFNAYSSYQSQKAQADYQNRIAGLYEKQYADTEARRAQAQANYDASVPK